LHTEAQNVAVTRGVFNALIGSTIAIPTSMAFDRAYFLGVSVDGGEELSPRTPLTAVPYALHAVTADVAANVLAGAAIAEPHTYRVDEVKRRNPGWTDGQAIQWIVDRLVKDDAGNTLAVPRSIRVMVPRRVCDVTGEPLKETSSPNGGATPGANSRILIPSVGPIQSMPFVTLVFEPEGGIEGTFSYSVVSAGNASVPSQECVIKTDDVTGNALIGVSSAVDGYAGTFLSNVIVVNNGVIFRVPNGAPITACDMSQALAIGGRAWIMDVGVSSDQIIDPRGTGSYALRTPRISNGGQMPIDRIAVQGYEHGVEVNEHLHVKNAFINYCAVAWRLRVTAHTALIEKSVVQWCPVHFSGARTTDPNRFAADCKLTVLQHGYECYDTAYFGPKWYEHVNVVEDPESRWSGTLNVQVDRVWLIGNDWPFMPLDHGKRLRIIMHDDVTLLRASALNFAGGLTTATIDTAQIDGRVWFQQPASSADEFVVEKWLPPGVHTITWTGRTGPGNGVLTLVGSEGRGDFYAGTPANNISRSFTVTQLVAGSKRLVFRVASKNAFSSGYLMELSRMTTTLNAAVN
ncbi:MAG: hypothetical protein H7X80_06635, partial [bacterium]|nr:hypothetical protein [Candidatus Kapabacteria bacterium]